MSAFKLVFILASVVYLAGVARAGSVSKVNEVLMNIPAGQQSVEAFVAAAENSLETKTKGIHLFNFKTVNLLKQVVAAGQAISGGDCSKNSYQLINSLPAKNQTSYVGWQAALDVFKREHNTTCLQKLEDSEKELYPTLDRKQVALIEGIINLLIPIVRRADYFDRNHLGTANSIKAMNRWPGLLNNIQKPGIIQRFTDEFIQYARRKGESSPYFLAYSLYITSPCQYYTNATSGIFEAQMSHYSNYETGVQNEDFNLHFLGYHLCQYFEREKTGLYDSLAIETHWGQYSNLGVNPHHSSKPKQHTNCSQTSAGFLCDLLTGQI